MQKSSMNTYIYAPKDDIKHRALWRQQYTSDEESKLLHFGNSKYSLISSPLVVILFPHITLYIGKLKVLIDAADKEGITFVYAISPGLDITFSSNADVSALKHKMKQVCYIHSHVVQLIIKLSFNSLK